MVIFKQNETLAIYYKNFKAFHRDELLNKPKHFAHGLEAVYKTSRILNIMDTLSDLTQSCTVHSRYVSNYLLN